MSEWECSCRVKIDVHVQRGKDTVCAHTYMCCTSVRLMLFGVCVCVCVQLAVLPKGLEGRY